MGPTNRRAGIAPAMVALALGVAGCGGASAGVEELGNPYSFDRIRSLASRGMSSSAEATARTAAIRSSLPEISTQYGDMLKTLDATYKEGLGAAKGSPAYADCKASFRDVAALLDTTPAADAEARGWDLQQRLIKCRNVARTWSIQGEIGTFGSDVRQVASGSLYVTSIAMIGSGATGPGDILAREAGAMMRADRPTT